MLVEYDPRWTGLFEREAARIRAVVPKLLRNRACGSTSVPGLPAKPILDIVLVWTDSADEAAPGVYPMLSGIPEMTVATLRAMHTIAGDALALCADESVAAVCRSSGGCRIVALRSNAEAGLVSARQALDDRFKDVRATAPVNQIGATA
ncbi:MAG: GrpB family protein [Acidobacteriota bacterium]